MIRAIGEWVILTMNEGHDKTPGGLIIPDIAKEKAVIGAVLSVGEEVKAEIGENDIVLVHKWGGIDCEIDGKHFRHCQIKDIICVLTKEKK